ncbi:MAG: methyltransferase domain-containing protein [Chloroflexota bacterium]
MKQSASNKHISPSLALEERLTHILEHLGIEHAHIAGMMLSDWGGFAAKYPDRISSLTIIPWGPIDPTSLHSVTARLLAVIGDQAADFEEKQKLFNELGGIKPAILKGHAGLPWNDVILDYKDEIGSAMLSFLKRMDARQGTETLSLSDTEGEVAGITYKIQGSGPPLILLPLSLAPSQWQPLLSKLSEQYCTITLGGPELGFIPVLEARGRSVGYQRMLRHMMDEMQPQADESILEVGCGTGAIDRWLARHTNGANRIVGVDINDYLLNVAATLAQMESLNTAIEFRKGNAEKLPFSDDEFDIIISSTVMEEVDADKMLAEMIRVTKPGGRVGVIVRGTDMPWVYNLPLGAELKAKIETPVPTDEGKGCASVSLYRRFQQSPLTNIKMMPQQVPFDDPDGGTETFIENRILLSLDPEEVNEWQSAKAKAVSEGTFFFTWPHHCAVGTKPTYHRLIVTFKRSLINYTERAKQRKFLPEKSKKK